jgi:hypothetical protein
MLVAFVSHFSELKTELEEFESRRSMDLTKDEPDALWIWVRMASNLLASHAHSLVARNPPDGVGISGGSSCR